MTFVAIVCIIFALLYCVAAAITGGMAWSNTRDWRLLAGTCFYIIAAILLTIWLLGSCT